MGEQVGVKYKSFMETKKLFAISNDVTSFGNMQFYWSLIIIFFTYISVKQVERLLTVPYRWEWDEFLLWILQYYQILVYIDTNF